MDDTVVRRGEKIRMKKRSRKGGDLMVCVCVYALYLCLISSKLKKLEN